jgi:LysR family transcriptional regulator for bpeEF and oprC
MDRFDAMRAFVQVLDSGSFTQAARALVRHKATVSQQVQQLEEHLGVRLLTRTTRSVAPTDEGRAYYARAVEIIAQVDEAEAWLRIGSRALGGALRVDVPVALGRLVLMPEIRSFLERHPRITLDLACSDRTVDVVREGVDCAIRGGELPDSTLVARHVGDVPFVLCAAPRYVGDHGLPREPDELAAHWRIGYRPAQQSSVRSLRLLRGGEAIEIELPKRLVTTDSGALLGAGLDGLGLIQIAEFVARAHLASGALVRILPGWQSPPLPLHLVSTTARLRTARVQAFMEWAQALLARTLGTPGTPRIGPSIIRRPAGSPR